jgi:hypothetical protein
MATPYWLRSFPPYPSLIAQVLREYKCGIMYHSGASIMYNHHDCCHHLLTGLLEAPVCVYCDTLLYLDDTLMLPGTEDEIEMTEQSQEVQVDMTESQSLNTDDDHQNVETVLKQSV